MTATRTVSLPTAAKVRVALAPVAVVPSAKVQVVVASPDHASWAATDMANDSPTVAVAGTFSPSITGDAASSPAASTRSFVPSERRQIAIASPCGSTSSPARPALCAAGNRSEEGVHVPDGAERRDAPTVKVPGPVPYVQATTTLPAPSIPSCARCALNPLADRSTAVDHVPVAAGRNAACTMLFAPLKRCQTAIASPSPSTAT